VKESPQASSFGGGGDGFLWDNNIENKIVDKRNRARLQRQTTGIY
jgi:hypothetical protein